MVQETVIKTIPKKKKWKKVKRLSEEDLQTVEKRREVKGKEQKERYTHLNTEFQRTARRDKKAFLSEQCKEIEENDRMRMISDLIKKIRDLFKKITCQRHFKGSKKTLCHNRRPHRN